MPSLPPLMVAEILSRDDSMVDVEEKTAEDAAWGVRNVWLVNPWDGDQFTTVPRFELPEFGWTCAIDDLMEGISAEALKK